MEIKFHILLCNISTVSPDWSESYYACYDRQKPHFTTHGITTRVLQLSSPLFLKFIYCRYTQSWFTCRWYTAWCLHAFSPLNMHHVTKCFRKIRVLAVFMYFIWCEVYGKFQKLLFHLRGE